MRELPGPRVLKRLVIPASSHWPLAKSGRFSIELQPPQIRSESKPGMLLMPGFSNICHSEVSPCRPATFVQRISESF